MIRARRAKPKHNPSFWSVVITEGIVAVLAVGVLVAVLMK
jgi:hypothetical protein